MNRRSAISWLLAALLLSVGLATASGQDAQRSTRGSFSSMVDVDALMDNYIRILSRKYDLSEEQAAYTRDFVQQRVDQFLEQHRDNLSGLVDRLVDVRSGGEISQAELMAWGEQVLPIYQEAREIIIQGNDEWRGILNERQKVIHDQDLLLMEQSFATTEDQLSRLVTGEMTVEEFRNPRRHRRTRPAEPTPQAAITPDAAQVEAQPAPEPARRPEPRAAATRQPQSDRRATPSRRPANVNRRPVATPGAAAQGERQPTRPGRQPARSTAGANEDNFESKWEAYVKQFIERYDLNEEQQAQAHKILKSCQNTADRYMRGRRTAIDEIDKELGKLATSQEPDKAQKLSQLTQKRTELLKPLDEIFERQLKPRLEKLPTRAQRDAAEKGPKSQAPTPGEKK